MVAALRQQAAQREAERRKKPKKNRQDDAAYFPKEVNSFTLCVRCAWQSIAPLRAGYISFEFRVSSLT
jgi:hypothetical protein